MGVAAKNSFEKCPTGIDGLDNLTRGGLPRGRTTLVAGEAGSGKTVLALQTLVNGARLYKEPGIFVAFEEAPRRILANMAGFDWNIPSLQPKGICFIDAKCQPDMAQSGDFDMAGFLAILGAKAKSIGAKRIVLDSVDVLLDLLDDPKARQRELFRIHEWLLANEITAIITAKTTGLCDVPQSQFLIGPLQFMVDCVLLLGHDLVDGVSQRHLQVRKYRGSGFVENRSPMVLGETGIVLAGGSFLERPPLAATSERVSTGVARLDKMLAGGYYRGASVLITGAPGTAKTTLCGTFASACCQRGEKTLFVSFDSEPAEIVRNLASIGLNLAHWQRKKLLMMASARSGMSSAEDQFLRIRQWATAHQARNLIIDPISALTKQGNELTAHSVVERLTDWAKSKGITMLCTSLLDDSSPETEGTPIQISTIADTWIHLSYLVHAGERNRALTIVKSRGTAHSNQVRELILRDSGVTLEDVYTAGGEVLLGTLRWEAEQARRMEAEAREDEARRKLAGIEKSELELAEQIKTLQIQVETLRSERSALLRSEQDRLGHLSERTSRLKGLRLADDPTPPKKAKK